MKQTGSNIPKEIRVIDLNRQRTGACTVGGARSQPKESGVDREKLRVRRKSWVRVQLQELRVKNQLEESEFRGQETVRSPHPRVATQATSWLSS